MANRFMLILALLVTPVAASLAESRQHQADAQSALPSPRREIAAATLEAHNRHRVAVGAPRLQWSDALANSARAYGPALAKAGKLVHSPRESRPGESENLWMGTRNAFSVDAMVEHWAEERRLFRAGVFPNVSTRGDWRAVSHYSQMIWPGTTHVGCHVERSRAHDFLICRYSPQGNRDGRWVGRRSD